MQGPFGNVQDDGDGEETLVHQADRGKHVSVGNAQQNADGSKDQPNSLRQTSVQGAEEKAETVEHIENADQVGVT